MSIRYLALPVGLLLSACTTVGPNFERLPDPATKSYAMAGDPSPTLPQAAATGGPWWTALGSPKLDALIADVLAHSGSVAEAETTLQRAQALAAAERGAELPQVEGEAGLSRERINTAAFGFSDFPSPTVSLYSIGATVTYDLDLFGGRRRAIEAAEADAETERQRAEAARLSLSGNVALQALRIAALNEQLDALHLIVEDDRRMVEMIRKAEAAGGSARTDITGGRVQLAEDEALIPPVERELVAARHLLAQYRGQAPSDWTPPDFRFSDFAAPAQPPLDVPSALVRRRPDLLASEAALHAATARIGVAKAAQYPNISLSAGLTQTALEPETLFSGDSSGWHIGPDLVGPIFAGGSRKARREAAEADARAALLRYQMAVIRAFVQVSDALAALGADERALATANHAEQAAIARRQDAEAAFRLGAAAQVQLVDAQRSLSRTRRATAQARGQQWADLVQLYTATAAPWRGPK
jgi:NodT family efflux transporter outer membrane factor (OMF) lipoprotein